MDGIVTVKKVRLKIYLLVLVVFGQLMAVSVAKTMQPNVILIVTDDQGWGDVSFNGNTVLQTPNIDQIGQQGVSFERFYVNPVCSSTRAALLTGRYFARTGVFSVTRGGEKMRESEITLAEMLKEKGYRTGLFGKWHNGSQYPHDPNGQGFDESFGVVDGHQTLYFDPMLVANGKPYQGKGYIADITTNAAIQFIQNAKSQPFFAYIPFNTPHSPFEVPQKYFDKYKKMGQSDLNASVYGMMENVDDNVGRILAKVKELNLAQDTIVLYMSDNGPAFPNKTPRYNGGLKGSKGKVDEGGVRSPLFVHWPNHITGGRTIKSIAQHIDIVPTIMSIVKARLPQDRVIDGVDISPLLFNTMHEKNWPARSLFVNQFHNVRKVGEQAINPAPGAVRTQEWLATYQRNGKWQLYDMRSDERQKFDIAHKQPKILKELQQQYFAYFDDVTQVKYAFIPTEIGHKGYDVIQFPSHDAQISGKAVEYAHDWGWAHDWINLSRGDNEGSISWPIKVVTKGKYRVSVKYAASSKVVIKGALHVAGKSSPLTVSLQKYLSMVDKGNRLYYTSEAPELTWKTMVIGEFELLPEQGELRLNLNQVNMNHGTGNMQIKGLVVTKVSG